MKRTFGVEIELNTESSYGCDATLDIRTDGTTGNRMVEIRERRSWDDHRPNTKRCKIALEPGWKAVYDGSCGSEFVSPPLIDTTPIRIQLDNIESAGLEYNLDSCGLHVHVGAQDFNPTHLLNIARFCRYFDRTIFSFMDARRIKDEYCRPMAKSNDQIRQDIAYSGGGDRYKGCNLASWWKHGTIEFRYAEGTICYSRIRSYVHLFTGIVDFVRRNPDFKLKCRPNIKKKRQYLLSLIDMPEDCREVLLSRDSSKRK